MHFKASYAVKFRKIMIELSTDFVDKIQIECGFYINDFVRGSDERFVFKKPE